MTTYTLHSNNAKMLRSAAELIAKNPADIATMSNLIAETFKYRVAISCTGRVGEDAANDYRFHQTVEASA